MLEGCSCRVLECHPQCFNPLNNAPGCVCGCAFVCRSMCALMGFNTCTGGQQRLAAECIDNRTPFKYTHSLASKMLAHDSYGEQASCNAVGDWVAGDGIYFIFTNTRGKVQTTFFSCLCSCTWIRKKIKNISAGRMSRPESCFAETQASSLKTLFCINIPTLHG